MPKKREAQIKLTALDKVSAVLGKIGRKFGRLGSKLKSAGQNMTQFISLPAALAGGAIIKVASDFEHAGNKLKAFGELSGKANEKAFKKMIGFAKKLGATTQFTATDATLAMVKLVKAGLNSAQALEAITPVMNLAVIGEMDLADSSDKLTKIMAAFGKKAKDLPFLVDMLTRASISAKTEIGDLANAVSFAGGEAAFNKMEFAELVSILALLSEKFGSGGRAGRTFARVMDTLTKLTKEKGKVLEALGLTPKDVFTAEGRVKNFTKIIEAFGKGTPQQIAQVFKTLAKRAVQQLVITEKFGVKGAAVIEKLTGMTRKAAGLAPKIVSEISVGSFKAMRDFISALENLAITMGETGILKQFTDATNAVTKFLRSLAKADPKLLKLGTVFIIAAAALGPFLMDLGLVALGISALLGPVGITLLVMGGLGASVIFVWRNWDKLKKRLSQKGFWGTVEEGAKSAGRSLRLEFGKFLLELPDNAKTALETLGTGFKDIGKFIFKGLRAAWNGLIVYMENRWKTFIGTITSTITDISQQITKFQELLGLGGRKVIFLKPLPKPGSLGPGPSWGPGLTGGGVAPKGEIDINIIGALPGTRTTIKKAEGININTNTKTGLTMMGVG